MGIFDIFKKREPKDEDKSRGELQANSNQTATEKNYMTNDYRENNEKAKQQALEASMSDGLPADTKEFYGSVYNHWNSSERHFELIHIIDEEYKRLNADNLLSDKSACARIISLCKEDIALAPELKGYFLETTPSLLRLPTYPSFKRLSIIYENLGEIPKAINVLEQAIELGFDSDNTKSGMRGRIERLTKKL